VLSCWRHPHRPEVLVSRHDAPLSPTGRLLARCVSVPCTPRWAGRYRTHGAAGMLDRPSRPRTARGGRPASGASSTCASPRRWGPVRIAAHLQMAASTVDGVLCHQQLTRLTHLDRATARAVRRYERERPGELVHVDIKKLGNIPDGGGHRIHGRAAGSRNSTRSAAVSNNSTIPRPELGYSYLHNALDDHSRLACTEILPGERKDTAAAFWAGAAAWFTAQGIDRIERVLTTTAPLPLPRLRRRPDRDPHRCTSAPAPTAAKPTGEPPCPRGDTPTTITAPAGPPPAASPTCPGRTPRRRTTSAALVRGCSSLIMKAARRMVAETLDAEVGGLHLLVCRRADEDGRVLVVLIGSYLAREVLTSSGVVELCRRHVQPPRGGPRPPGASPPRDRLPASRACAVHPGRGRACSRGPFLPLSAVFPGLDRKQMAEE
jgi:hypothetical protein